VKNLYISVIFELLRFAPKIEVHRLSVDSNINHELFI